MKITIGLIGEARAGKETVSNIIGQLVERDGFSSYWFQFRTPLEETLAAWGIEVNRTNLQLLVHVMEQDEAFKKGALSRAVSQRALNNPADVVLLDGMRLLTDEVLVRSIPHALVLYVTANFDVRTERARARCREGEEKKTIEHLREEERRPTEVLIAEMGKRADRIIVNNSNSLEALTAEVAKFYRSLVLPRLRLAV